MFVGWSVGGVIAFEVARHLMLSGVSIEGVILIDSPHPYTSTPLTDDIIDCAFSKHAVTGSRAVELAKTQMKHATRALVLYDPDNSPALSSNLTKAVMLRSREAFMPAGTIVADKFLSDRDDSNVLCAGWERALGYAPTVLDIPGNHFEPFEPQYVSRRSVWSCL